jgi:hypothetical protein
MDSCKCGDDFENPMSFEVDEEDESFVWDFEIFKFLKMKNIKASGSKHSKHLEI